MKRNHYKTKNRDAILKFLKDYKAQTHRYITAKEVAKHFAEGEKISQATVYRVLDKFAKEGILNKYELEGENSAGFEYVGEHSDCSHHYHLKCNSCGKIVHFDCESMKGVEEHLNNHHGFKIDALKTIFYGTCKDCNYK